MAGRIAAASPASLSAVPDNLTPLLLVVLGLAVLFDYINGFHDTANSIATSVSTRALKPEHAILMSATANFVGALTGTAVANTIASGLATTPDGAAGQTIVAAALVGAIAWNLLTWRLGIPSSSSHALIGGLLGAVIVSVGTEAIKVDGVRDKVLVPLVLSPVLGIMIGFLFMVVLLNVFRHANPRRLNERFRRLQVLSAAYMAFSHGSNDAQKTMGIMTLALLAAGVIPTADIPLWVILLAATAISLGTAAGGWRIIRTMGQRVVKLDPVHGFAAETTAATIIFTASHFGMPVSTTHVISSAIMGVGASDRSLRGSMGRGRQHHHRLDPDDPGVRARSSGGVLRPRRVPLARPRAAHLIEPGRPRRPSGAIPELEPANRVGHGDGPDSLAVGDARIDVPVERLAAERCGKPAPALDRGEVEADQVNLAGEDGQRPPCRAPIGSSRPTNGRAGHDGQRPVGRNRPRGGGRTALETLGGSAADAAPQPETGCASALPWREDRSVT